MDLGDDRGSCEALPQTSHVGLHARGLWPGQPRSSLPQSDLSFLGHARLLSERLQVPNLRLFAARGTRLVGVLYLTHS